MPTVDDSPHIPAKYGADIRLLATALVSIFQGASLDETLLAVIFNAHSGLLTHNLIMICGKKYMSTYPNQKKKESP